MTVQSFSVSKEGLHWRKLLVNLAISAVECWAPGWSHSNLEHADEGLQLVQKVHNNLEHADDSKWRFVCESLPWLQMCLIVFYFSKTQNWFNLLMSLWYGDSGCAAFVVFSSAEDSERRMSVNVTFLTGWRLRICWCLASWRACNVLLFLLP